MTELEELQAGILNWLQVGDEGVAAQQAAAEKQQKKAQKVGAADEFARQQISERLIRDEQVGRAAVEAYKAQRKAKKGKV